MTKVMVFVGTRPEAIKMAPVVRELAKSKVLSSTLCSTGQHKEMLDQAFEDFGIVPDHKLDVMRPGQSLAGLSSRLFTAVDEVLEEERPDWVVVQGDTTTVAITSLCAFYRQIKVVHVEAGLRSHQKYSPFPEEVNRRVAGVVADLHMAPTNEAKANLLAEGVDESCVAVAGNTVIDALLWMRDKVAAQADMLPDEVLQAKGQGKKIVLVTGHRRESFGGGFENICKAIMALAKTRDDIHFVYPVHLNPVVKEPVQAMLGDLSAVSLIDPMTYKPFVALMNVCHIILTDSGGIQEEGPSLGKPVLVMRDVTERPEGVEAGTAKLVGVSIDRIIHEVTELLDNADAYEAMSRAVNPYGDGQAAKRIVELLEQEARD